MEDELLDRDFDAIFGHARDDLAGIGPPGQFAPAETLGPEPSFWDRAANFFIDKLVPEVWDAVEHEVSLGASELAKALLGHSDGFVLYGPSLDPIQTYDIPEPPQQSFDDQMAQASQVWGPEQDRDLER